MAARYRYTPWGVQELFGDTIRNNLRFHGAYWSEGGLYYLRNRGYDPLLQRFLSERPLGLEAGINPYAFVGNRPMDGRDPSGMSEEGPQCTPEQLQAADRVPGSLGNAIRAACHRGGAPLALPGLVVNGQSNSGFGFGDLASVGIGSLPVVGDLYDLGTAIGGYDPLTGDHLGWGGRGLALAGAALPFIDGAELRAASNILPDAARTTINSTEVFRRLERYHGIAPDLASARLHSIKREFGRGGAANVLFDLTGGVYDPGTRSFPGSLTQGGAK